MARSGRGAKRHTSLLSARYRDWCFYCGERASCRDHYNPWVYSRLSYWLPSCYSCNSLLGAYRAPTLGRRAAYIAHKLRRRNRKVLRADYPRINPGTEGHLRRGLEYEQNLQHVLDDRLRWLDTIETAFDAVEMAEVVNAKETIKAFLDVLLSRRRHRKILLVKESNTDASDQDQEARHS